MTLRATLRTHVEAPNEKVAKRLLQEKWGRHIYKLTAKDCEVTFACSEMGKKVAPMLEEEATGE